MFGIRSVTFFLARLILGYIFIMHGWQKLHTNGIDATKRAFEAHPNRGCRSWGLKPPVSSRLRAM